jgi:hypothetical protein
MSVRFMLPVAAVGLALIAPGQLAAQGSPSTTIRPAQGTDATRCDDLLQQADARMSTALAVNVHGATADVQQARDLCNSGHPEQGIPILRRVLSSMYNN